MAYTYTLKRPRFTQAPTQTVEVKRKRADAEWIALPQLRCTNLSLRAGPDVSSAKFRVILGKRRGPGEVEASAALPYDLREWYVRVTLTYRKVDPDAAGEETDTETQRVWMGRFTDEGLSLEGRREVAGREILNGRQTFNAYGIEAMLGDADIRRAIVTGTSQVLSPLTFNGLAGARSKRGLIPNRAPTATGGDPTGVYRFGKNIRAAETWTQLDALRYVLHFESPRKLDGTALFTVALEFAGDEADQLLSDMPLTPLAGHSAKDILDNILNRRRALSYAVSYDDTGITITPFSFSDETAGVAGETILVANANPVTIEVFDSTLIQSCHLDRNSQLVIDQAIGQGAKRVSACTANHFGTWDGSSPFSTYVGDWTSDQLDAYNAAASTHGDYPATDDEFAARDRMNTAVRADNRLAAVFREFRLTPTFSGPYAVTPTLDVLDYSGVPTESSVERYEPEMRVLPCLPWTTDVWPVNPLDPEPLNETADDTGIAEQVRIFALMSTDQLSAGSVTWGAFASIGDRWCYLDQGATSEDGAGDGCDRVKGSIRPLDSKLGFEIKVAPPQHNLGADEFDPLPGTSDEPPAAAYYWIIVTVAIEQNDRVEIRVPLDGDVVIAGDRVRRLYLDRPDCRLDYIVPDTVIGLDPDDAGKLVQSDGGFIRDDRIALEVDTTRAYRYYRRERNHLSITLKGYWNFSIGELVTDLGFEIPYRLPTGEEIAITEVNTPITRVDFDFDKSTTSISTDLAQLGG